MSLGWEGALWLIPVLAGGVGAGTWARWARIRRAERYLRGHSGPELWPETPGGPVLPGAWNLRGWVLVVSAVSLVLALGDPRVGTRQVPVPSPAAPLFIFMDVSPSMAVNDVQGDRLTGARMAVRRVLSQLSGTPVGLGVFAGEAHVLLPPSTDESILLSTLDAVAPAMLSGSGTRLAAPMEVLLATEAGGEGDGPDRAGGGFGLLLLSDGEDHGARQEALSLAREIRRMGGWVSTVAVGSPEGGQVPLPRVSVRELRLGMAGAEAGERRPVSRADPAFLSEVAEAGGGAAARWDSLDEMTGLLKELEDWGVREASGVEMKEVPLAVWVWFLSLALAGLFLETALDWAGLWRSERWWR